MKINEIAELYNITPHTLRYYEKIGLLKPEYLKNGYRTYTYEHIKILNTIRDLRFFSLPLSKIQDYLMTKNVNKTLEILALELKALDNTLVEINKKKYFLKERIDLIDFAVGIPTSQIQIIKQNKRIIVTGKKIYSTEENFYYELKSLHSLYRSILNSNNQNIFGALIYEEQKNYFYQAFYFANQPIQQPHENLSILPNGNYLTYTYSGKYKQMNEIMAIMNNYITTYSLQAEGPFYEIYLIDFHETNETEEFVTQIEILLSEKK